MDVAVAGWLASIDGVIDPKTYVTYHGYSLRWLGRWSSLDELHDSAIAAFVQDRLRSVLAKSVRKELSAMRGMLSWARANGMLARIPTVPSIGKKVTGRRARRQAKSAIVNKGDLLAAIGRLPEWSRPRLGRRFPIRARIVLQYETGLRREALSLVEWTDWKGDTLEIRDEVDKARFGREIPLSETAVAALSALRDQITQSSNANGVASAVGPIFGSHDYRASLKPLARSLGLATVHLRALRHNRGTHLVDEGKPLSAVAYLFGHKHVSTTAIYARGTKEAAFEAIHGQKKKAT